MQQNLLIPRLRYMQKLLFQIFLIVCFMVYLKKYVNEHEKIYGIANIVFLSTAKYLIIVTRSIGLHLLFTHL